MKIVSLYPQPTQLTPISFDLHADHILT